VYLSSFPTGLSRVEARVAHVDAERLVDLVAGFIGVGQAEEGLALSPQIGWAVCGAEHARVFEALESRHITEPARDEDAGDLMLPGCPAFLCELHARYASMDMWSGALRLRPRSESEYIRLREEIAIVRFADLAEGSTLAYTWLHGVPPPHPLRWVIVHVPPGDAIESSALTIVARSPLELFQKLLDGDEPFFLAPRAELHGDLATALATFPLMRPEPPESSSLS